ncbi:MAG: hypothetical protein M0Z51_14690 [Propionibacterium sp.]|nr:hypothetical protein [Propionibacterium sp.]
MVLQPHPAALMSMVMVLVPDPSDPSSSPGRSWTLAVTPEKSAAGYAAFHSASAEATAVSRSAWVRSALGPTGVAGATSASRNEGVPDAVGVEVPLDVGVLDAVGVDVTVLDAVGVDVTVLDADGVAEVVAVGVLVVVGAGELVVGAGELVVGLAVDLAGVPELHVTELPSADRTQTICDPLLPDGLGAEPGTAEPDPGLIDKAGVSGGSVMYGRVVGAGMPLTEVVPTAGAGGTESGLVDTDPDVTTVRATALRASANPT